MKRLTLLLATLSLLMFAATTTKAQTFITLSATKVNAVTVSSTVYLNPDYILYARKSGTSVVLTYLNAYTYGVTRYTVSDTIEGIAYKANLRGSHLITLHTADAGASTSTLSLYNPKYILTLTAKTQTNFPLATTLMGVGYQQPVSTPIVETVAQIANIADSTNTTNLAYVFTSLRKQDSTWVKHGLHDTVFSKINGNISFDTIKR